MESNLDWGVGVGGVEESRYKRLYRGLNQKRNAAPTGGARNV